MTELSAFEIELFDAILALLRREGPMSSAELAEALEEDEDLIDDLLGSIDSDEFLWLLDDRWAESLRLLEGRVLTHRVTAAEVGHDLLTTTPDLELLLFLPNAARRLVSGEPLEPVFPDLATPDLRDVPDEVRHPGGSIPLPQGTFAALGVAAGDLVALTATARGIELRRVEPAELDDGQPVLEALTDLLAPDRPTDLESALMTLSADRPEVFRAPVPPVAELIATAGLAHDGDLVAPPGFPLVEYEEERRRTDLAETYDLTELEAQALLVLLQHYRGRIERGRDEVAAAVPSLAEPAVADALMRTSLLLADDAEALLALVDGLWAQSGRRVRPALQWLRAKALEWRGDVLAAEEALQDVLRLDPDWPLALLDLARYASDRGDAVRGLALLRRAEAYEDSELEAMLEYYLPSAGPAVGRNDPCWCGSGRKFKQCHLHRPGSPPLEERAHWLWNKARRYLADGRWRLKVEIVLELRTAYAEDDDAFAGGPDDPLVDDAVLFEGGAFADFLQVRGELLPADEQLLGEQWLLVDRSVFEVTAVRRGEGLTLRDLRTGDVHEVRERTASTSLRTGHLVCARVVSTGEVMQVFGGIEPVRPRDRDDLVALLDSDPTPEDLVRLLTRRFAPPTVVLTDRARRLLDSDEMEDVTDPGEPAVREAMTTYMADYEQKWLDLSVPALGGRTPREAAADPTRREDLVQLLATFPETDDPMQMSANRLRNALGLG